MDLQKLKKIIVQHEEERFYPYKCSEGFTTIGIGHNLDAKGISPEVSALLYQQDIDEVLDDLPTIFPDFDALPENIQMVLADMRFQLGQRGFMKFKNMIWAVKQNDWEGMIREMRDSSWYHQTPNRAKHLITLVEEVF